MATAEAMPTWGLGLLDSGSGRAGSGVRKSQPMEPASKDPTCKRTDVREFILYNDGTLCSFSGRKKNRAGDDLIIPCSF